MLRSEAMCMSMCVCVYLSVLRPKQPDRHWLNFPQIVWSQRYFWSTCFTCLKGFPFLYSVILTEYVAMEPGVCVCMCVCLCVCVCMCVCVSVLWSSAAQTDGWILMKFSPNDLINICEVCFSQILTFPNRWCHGGHFALYGWGTLKVAILLRFSSKS